MKWNGVIPSLFIFIKTSTSELPSLGTDGRLVCVPPLACSTGTTHCHCQLNISGLAFHRVHCFSGNAASSHVRSHSKTMELGGPADICARLLIPHFHYISVHGSLNAKKLP
ncbi:hypothetical protein FA13DRAFT_980444 [Coprinellus micaceus]|uniref:Secreted protein n=1 Tax=Coprinellus micaceus TaxID=71717 RepID=A0A4Y7RUB9_COPMI|nr:hypothetical protein FA13DRAFT_980444 [Coprinellus micaceus]